MPVGNGARPVDGRRRPELVHMTRPVFHRPVHIVCTLGGDGGHARARTLIRLVSSEIWL